MPSPVDFEPPSSDDAPGRIDDIEALAGHVVHARYAHILAESLHDFRMVTIERGGRKNHVLSFVAHHVDELARISLRYLPPLDTRIVALAVIENLRIQMSTPAPPDSRPRGR